MPDISMCSNSKCKLRKTCYRFTAKSSEYQCYSDYKPNKDGSCDDYWEVTK